MSGSGGSGGESGGWPESGDVDCEGLDFETNLSSLQPEVVRQLREGLVLDVGLDSERARVVVTHESRVVGTITGANLGPLLRCLQQGHEFEAVLNSVDGGDVRVQVRSR